MRVNEIFLSLQGEGVYSGLPMIFIRLAGCNLLQHCLYCDTAYSQSAEGGKEISVEDILLKVSSLLPFYKSWVCITGGEPLWQKDELEALVRLLKRGGYCIEIETNGSFLVPRWYTLVDSWNADIKCPSSGVCGVSKKDWWNTRSQDQIKFVVSTHEDLEFAKAEIEKNIAKSPQVLISPILQTKVRDQRETFMVNREFLREAWNFCVENRVRWSFQQHKIVWGNKKGV